MEELSEQGTSMATLAVGTKHEHTDCEEKLPARRKRHAFRSPAIFRPRMYDRGNRSRIGISALTLRRRTRILLGEKVDRYTLAARASPESTLRTHFGDDEEEDRIPLSTAFWRHKLAEGIA